MAVVGAGPAGLMAAWRAAQQGKSVTVCEALPTPGSKLLASGAGKCNLTNVLEPQALARRCGAAWRFLLPALYEFPPAALRTWFENRGVPLEVIDGFHIFPRSRRARDILDALLDADRMAGVRLRCGWPVEHLWREDGALCGVIGADGQRLAAPEVIVAGGGLGYPALGAGGLAYRLAREAGHALEEPVPALVGLQTMESWPGECRGIVLPDTEVRLDDREAGIGELLFSHRGVSGPAVIDVSGAVAARLAHGGTVAVTVNLSRPMDRDRWCERFLEWRRLDGRKYLRNRLAGEFPRALVEALCRLAEVPEVTRMAELSAAVRDRVIQHLTRLPLTITGTEGWTKAMATRGGVALPDVDARTLRSRRLPGLAFAGEVLDVDGPCGGFNLQWAFSSGYLAGALRTR